MSIFSNGGFTQIGGSAKVRSYRKNKDGKGGWDVGDQIAGTIVAIGKDKFSKPSYTIKVTDVEFKNKAEQPAVGELFILNTTGGIEHKIGQAGGVQVGDTIGIEYNGEVTVEKGTWKGSKTHDIEFFMSRGAGPRTEQPKQAAVESDSDLDNI